MTIKNENVGLHREEKAVLRVEALFAALKVPDRF